MPTLKSINLFHRLFWPVLAVAVCALLWGLTWSRADAERARADQQQRREASALAEAYEQYVTRSVGQMDQITMQLKHSAEHIAGEHLLESLKRDGMFTDPAFVAVGIVGPDGALRSSTHASLATANLAGTRFFRDHRDSISTALRIGPAPAELGLASDIVLFTRRIDTSGDEFAGVVLLAVNASYFTAFVGADTLGARGVVAVAALEGGLRVEQLGGQDASVQPPAQGSARDSRAVLPADASIWADAIGEKLLPVEGAGAFRDGVERVLAWRRSSGYPLVALVALSHEDALAEHGPGIRRAYTYKSLNKLIQGSAADMTKKSMLELYKEGIISHIQIHDELDLSIESEKQAQKIVEIMENAVTLEVPNKVDYEFGSNWGDIYD